ncbi:MAG: uridine kinase [Candidatus Stygibacter australis]|nr:uridine kinase [Candidatus Stygibacter australis]MDP8321386.1 uridine kinase [Candidatus Stygibacter australis]
MKPFLIGIAGGTASGKTTIANSIAKEIKGNIIIIKQDNYYYSFPEKTLEERAQLNFDHPHAFDTGLLISHLKQLKEYQVVQIPVFDYITHLRSETTIDIQPAKVIILEGILIFENKELRDLLDIRIFVDTDADIRILRRMERDIKERDRSFSSILEQYRNTVRPMHLEFVEPSKRFADIIIPVGAYNSVAIDMIVRSIKQKLSIREED